MRHHKIDSMKAELTTKSRLPQGKRKSSVIFIYRYEIYYENRYQLKLIFIVLFRHAGGKSFALATKNILLLHFSQFTSQKITESKSLINNNSR